MPDLNEIFEIQKLRERELEIDQEIARDKEIALANARHHETITKVPAELSNIFTLPWCF